MYTRQFLPNLNLLRVFEAAGRHLSFKDAADELCVTPSAVSQQVKKLEAQLGQELFKRRSRALSFTVLGEQYWKQVHKSLEQLHQSTADLLQPLQQSLKVSLMPPVANRLVLPRLNDFHQSNPDISLRIDASQKLRDVAKGEVDLAVRFGHPAQEDPSLVTEVLSEVYVQLVCPAGFSDRYALHDDPRNVLAAPMIVMSQSPETWERWLQHMGWGEPSGPKHMLDNYPSAIQAAESLGAMLALMPLEAELVKSGRLEAPLDPIGPIDKSVYVVYRADHPKVASIRLFSEWLKQGFEELAQAK